MLAVRDLWAGYDGAQVLRGITFEMAAGQCLAILGHNGAGKTTLIKALMGLLRLERGQIILHGRALHHASVQQRVRRGLGWVPQERGLFPSLTVQEHLAVVARPGPWNRSEEHTSELQSRGHLVCRLLLEKKNCN